MHCGGVLHLHGIWAVLCVPPDCTPLPLLHHIVVCAAQLGVTHTQCTDCSQAATLPCNSFVWLSLQIMNRVFLGFLCPQNMHPSLLPRPNCFRSCIHKPRPKCAYLHPLSYFEIALLHPAAASDLIFTCCCVSAKAHAPAPMLHVTAASPISRIACTPCSPVNDCCLPIPVCNNFARVVAPMCFIISYTLPLLLQLHLGASQSQFVTILLVWLHQRVSSSLAPCPCCCSCNWVPLRLKCGEATAS